MSQAYRIISWMLTPFIFLWLKRRMMQGKESRTRLSERLGVALRPRPTGKLIWVHAASVGEANSALPLIEGLQKKHSSLHILLTTGTVTSAEMMSKKLSGHAFHQFVPVDLPHAAARFMCHWQPDAVIWVESDLWPNLLAEVRRATIPALLVNARMSQRSFNRWMRAKRFFAEICRTFSAIYIGDEKDTAKWQTLGAERVSFAGNLKYDVAPAPLNMAQLQELKSQIAGRPCWLAASTHAGEEQIIFSVHQKLRQSYPDLLTMIVPRHPRRAEEITALIDAAGLKAARRSAEEIIDANIELYLADTMGELGLFYSLAPISFIGGSLVPVGGHNPIETAQKGGAMVTGNHLFNFAGIAEALQRVEALKIIHDEASLYDAVNALLAAPDQVKIMTENAKRHLSTQIGASEKIIAEIERLIPLSMLQEGAVHA